MKNSKGVSLIIAIIFVSAFMFVLAGLAEVQISTIRSIGLRRAETKIRYLTQAAEELGRLASDSHGPGWNSLEATNVLTGAAESVGLTLNAVSLSVIGRSDNNAKLSLNNGPLDYFSVPAPYVSGGALHATGDAGECAAGTVDADSACHWNKLYVGESVEIPLYYDGGDETPDFTGDKFALRIRTPCNTDGFKEPAGGCVAPLGRVELFPPTNDPAYRDIKKDPVLVQWTISGTEAGEVKTLIARDKKENAQKRHSVLNEENTELSAGRINAAIKNQEGLIDSIVLQRDFKGTEISTKKSEKLSVGQFMDGGLSKPVLRLSLVTQPTRAEIEQDDDGDTAPAYDPSKDANDHKYFIPFLEYQLLTQGEVPSDSKSTIAGVIESPEFRREFQVYRKHATTLGGFVLESL